MSNVTRSGGPALFEGYVKCRGLMLGLHPREARPPELLILGAEDPFCQAAQLQLHFCNWQAFETVF